MKRIKTFLSLLVFAVITAFSSVYAQSPSEKVIVLKAKSEKVTPAQTATPSAPNFVRTDALVFYESTFEAVGNTRLIGDLQKIILVPSGNKFFVSKTTEVNFIKFSYKT